MDDRLGQDGREVVGLTEFFDVLRAAPGLLALSELAVGSTLEIVTDKAKYRFLITDPANGLATDQGESPIWPADRSVKLVGSSVSLAKRIASGYIVPGCGLLISVPAFKDEDGKPETIVTWPVREVRIDGLKVLPSAAGARN